ncbi:MAG: hybrid sensor histidine kinase/response regulator [Anaerolineae bacterium]
MTTAQQNVSSKSKTILIIEDSEDLRYDVIEMLNMEGYNTSGAENGAVGVEMARKIMPDLIVCDIMMPVMDGFGVLEALRSDLDTASIPFIFLTAKTEHIDQRQGMVLGADDFLTKPFMVEELLESIRSQLKKRDDQLASVKKRIDELTASIALALPHELRTPLNTVIGFSEMLQSEAQNLKPDQVAGWAGYIHNAGYRLYRVVENYLLFVRLQLLMENSYQPDPSDMMIDMHTIIEEHAMALANKLKRADDLILELQPAPPVWIDNEHGVKIIEELLDNAFKFSTQGQKVTVKTFNEGDTYTLVISDKGRGMSPEQIKDINAFMQFERSHYEQQGMGLGLALVKQLSAIYDIEFEPIGEKDKGITVTVRFKKK